MCIEPAIAPLTLEADVLRFEQLDVAPDIDLPSGDARTLARLAQGVTRPGCAVLPGTRFGRSVAFPVIEWYMDALARRHAQAPAPVLYRDVLCHRLETNPGSRDESPLRIRGYIHVGPLDRDALSQLGPLRGWHSTIVAVPAALDLDPLLLAECDVRGDTVVQVDVEHEHADVVVEGATRGRSEHRRELLELYWLREEQLYDVAQRTGDLPAFTA